MRQFQSDALGSSDIEDVLEMSRTKEHSGAHGHTGQIEHSQPFYSVKHEINARISTIETELQGVDEDIRKLQELRSSLVKEKQKLVYQLNDQNSSKETVTTDKGKARASTNAINYTTERFDWSGELRSRMRMVFGIDNYRLCQEGVCNANMDGRDIVCIMPTGGGKSLTYQLPALLNPGCTLVISPLISLITDQILHLREFGVEAVKLTGTTTKEESREIFGKLMSMSGIKGRRGSTSAAAIGPDIKLCYVTPEKIAKSKTFVSMLEKLASAGKLARIVIDEAHCVSQLGHDFRPDYKKLSILRQLFPRVPILALSATCPPKVLKDLLLTLRLKPVVDGNAADRDGTALFSAPLYRKNLHYSVLPKPPSAEAAVRIMAEYILDNHRDESGIVYCLSKKDTENVAEGLAKTSGGKIRTGVYHADVHDKEKEQLHCLWRKGDVKVVCATIAFGLGIDKGDVRFVLHHSMSKSLDGYYQESGRAGRDGKDADCILFYRPQDASRLSAIVCGEREGQEKLHDMLSFAQDLVECRKIQFAKYFSSSASLSISAWATSETNALDRCGHCDNCARPADCVDRKDVTLMAWQVLRVASTIEREQGRVTLGMLGDRVRGLGGGSYGVTGGGRRGNGKVKEKADLNLDEVAGGKVTLSKDDTESLLMHLLLTGYLMESFHSTAYSINVYVRPGSNALRLTRWSREDIESGKGTRLIIAFINKKASRKGGNAKGAVKRASGVASSSGGSWNNQPSTGKRKRLDSLNIASEDDGSSGEGFIVHGKADMSTGGSGKGTVGRSKEVGVDRRKHQRMLSVPISDEDEGDSWIFDLRAASRDSTNGKVQRRRLNSSATRGSDVAHDDVIELSDSE